MTQREVTDAAGTTWACVQAYTGGLQTEQTEEARSLTENDSGDVPVVCTPRGGEQSVRLSLRADWQEELADEELLKEIAAAQK